MSTNDTGLSVDVGDPRVQALVGVAIAAVAMAGLYGWIPTMLEDWARWFLFTGLFFGGMSFAMYALTNLD